MPSVVTTAIVLHALNYSESSRILRLATRDAGVQSVMARGARSSQRRFGSAVDLFAEGEVQYETRPGRDLHTLARFDVVRSRVALGGSLERFEGASALAEVMLRVAADDDTPADAFDALRDGLDAITGGAEPAVESIRAIWRLLSAIGFTPALDACVQCDRELAPGLELSFSADAGGVLCDGCAARVPCRRLPATARATVRGWLAGEPAGPLRGPGLVADPPDGGKEPASAGAGDPTVRAHRRLLRIFVHAHLTDGRPLRAFDAWAAT
ncbi:MAG: DNA repair protein RecO [Gemmatimonadaceae bacterium]|nr:DNA repair protein RecO [Gemmatimonadaceae bacterium]